MRVLIIGGTGNLSYACSVAAVDAGFEVFNLNRGSRPEQSAPGVVTLQSGYPGGGRGAGGARGPALRRGGRLHLLHARAVGREPLDLLRDRTDQYCFISTASAYRKPPDSSCDHGGDTARQSLLGLLPRQDRLRAAVGGGGSRPGPPLHHRAPLPHLRARLAAARLRLFGLHHCRADVGGPTGHRPRRRPSPLDPDPCPRLRRRPGGATRPSGCPRGGGADHGRGGPDLGRDPPHRRARPGGGTTDRPCALGLHRGG